MRTLNVDLGERSYPIYSGAGLLQQANLLKRHIRGRQALIVSNETVAPLYLQQVQNNLQGLQIDVLVLPDGEAYKTLETLQKIYDKLLQSRHNRTTTLIALGGGVIGDMTGFAAATYQRGVDFIQIPTTLLAQVDSSVGGKTGVNHPLGKNMIGAFHQPQCVLADTETLNTLPDRELAAGVAEVIKYGLICDTPFYDWLEENLDGLMERNGTLLAEAIERSCGNKARVVAADERESGIRAILNLGHTFGHAIETAEGYGAWLHGEAVAAGMVMAADLSARMGWLASEEVARLSRLLARAGLPVAPPATISDERFLELMAVDKKVIDGRMRLVLLKAIGEAVVTDEIPVDTLRQTLSATRSTA